MTFRATPNGSVRKPGRMSKAGSSGSGPTPTPSLSIISIGLTGSTADLNLDSPDDYVIYGDGLFGTVGIIVYTRKAGGGSTISASLYGGTPNSATYNDSPRLVTAGGGSPIATVTNWPGGIYDTTNGGGGTATGGGFTIVVPAGIAKRTMRVYCGGYAARLTVSSYLSDLSAPNVSNTTALDPGGASPMTGFVEIEFAANSNGQTLTVDVYVNNAYGGYANTGLQAVTTRTI